MRKKIVAGNWKCNTTLQEGIALAKEVNNVVNTSNVQVILGTPFIHLTEVVKLTTNKAIAVAAQNCAAEAKGAFTGEVSAAMVKSITTSGFFSDKKVENVSDVTTGTP